MLKVMIAAAVICGAALISACSAEPGEPAGLDPSSTSIAAGETHGDQRIAVTEISGPLDAVQARLSASVFDPLISSAAATPLEGLLRCADAVVVRNTLDIADSLLARSAGNEPISGSSAGLTEMLGSLAIRLTQMLQALAGTGGGCSADSASLEQIGFDRNALAGTPYEALGRTLGPLLARVAIVVEGHDDPEAGDPPLSAEQATALMTDIDHAVQLGLQQVALETRRTPLIGGVLNTVATALTDNTRLITAKLGNEPTAIRDSLQKQLEHTLANTLVQVLPVRPLEAAAGQPDLIGSPIRISVLNYGSLWAEQIGAVAAPAQTGRLDEALESVFVPVERDLLPVVLAMLGEALERQPPGSGATLDSLTAALSSTIEALLAGSTDNCQFATLPLLSGLCRSM